MDAILGIGNWYHDKGDGQTWPCQSTTEVGYQNTSYYIVGNICIINYFDV